MTYDALRKHDAMQGMGPRIAKAPESVEMEQDSEYSTESSYNTMDTFASDWSACSNISFNRFLKVFRPNSAIHKEMLAILAAITEVIKENGGSGTSVEYYCSLVSYLIEK